MIEEDEKKKNNEPLNRNSDSKSGRRQTKKQGPASQRWVLGHFNHIKQIKHIQNIDHIQQCQSWIEDFHKENFPFLAFKKRITDHPTIRRTDTPSYRDGWTHLKRKPYLIFYGVQRDFFVVKFYLQLLSFIHGFLQGLNFTGEQNL